MSPNVSGMLTILPHKHFYLNKESAQPERFFSSHW